MKTASFFTYSGPGRISIARGLPRGIKGYRRYITLAPEFAWFRLPKTQFLANLGIPDRLDPKKTWNELHALVDPLEPVLLCFEKPGDVCHRLWVAEWFQETLGKLVEEIQDEPKLSEHSQAAIARSRKVVKRVSKQPPLI